MKILPKTKITILIANLSKINLMQKEVYPSYKLEDHAHEQWNQLKKDTSSWRYCQNSLSLPSFSFIREEYQKIFKVFSNSSYLSLPNQFLKETKYSISFILYPSLRLYINATIKMLLERFWFLSFYNCLQKAK